MTAVGAPDFDLHEITYIAELAHRGQVRDFTGEPYITHPLAVAEIIRRHGGSELEVFGAILHDAIEDSEGRVTYDYIRWYFSESKVDSKTVEELIDILHYVTKVSKKEDGNRARRIAIDAAHYSLGSSSSQNIKIADMLHNLPDLVKNNREFAKKYVLEKEALLKVLTKAKTSLRLEAHALIKQLKEELYK